MCHVLKLSVLIILLILVLTDSKQHLHFSAHLQWHDTESQSVLMLLFRYESIQASLHGTRGSSQQMLQYLLYNCYHSPTEAYTMTRWLKSITLDFFTSYHPEAKCLYLLHSDAIKSKPDQPSSQIHHLTRRWTTNLHGGEVVSKQELLLLLFVWV